MKKHFIFFILALCIMAFTPQAIGQNLQEVLDKHFEAVGQENLLKKETQTIKATVDQMGMQIPMTLQIKRPDKFRMEMEMQGQKMIQTYNGEKGWMIAPWMSQEPQELSGAELSQAREQANIDGELYNYAAKGAEAFLAGKVNVEGTPMYNIKLTGKDGSVKNYFIDAKDYLVRKVRVKMQAQGQEVEVEQNLSDYEMVDGVMMPTKIESKNPMGSAVITFNTISFNEKMDDDLFDKP